MPEGSNVPGPSVTARGTQKLMSGIGQRIMSAAATVARVQKHFGPLGITRVANVTGLDCIGIPVVTVCRPNARSLSLSQGKGLDIDAARASGVMEAIELYHAERIDLPLKLASFNELRFSQSAVDVEQLPRIGLSQFKPTAPLLWIEGVELNGGSGLWLPFELVHMNLTLPFPTGTGCFVLSSNGLASGNHLLEAVVHGLCEVIERDAATVFLSQPVDEQDERQIDLDSVDDAVCQRLLELYARAGVGVGVWDITSDVGVPAFRCAIIDREDNPFRRLPPLEGMGCHLVREAALARALTEAAQARLTMITGSRDDNLPHLYKEVEDQEYLQASRRRILRPGSRSFLSVSSRPHPTLEEDLTAILAALKAANLSQVIAVDLTKPGLDIPVVRVVVPGLEPYHGVHGGRGGVRASRAARAEGVAR
jgi:YcaO-like protein with predicted kinase domain